MLRVMIRDITSSDLTCHWVGHHIVIFYKLNFLYKIDVFLNLNMVTQFCFSYMIVAYLSRVRSWGVCATRSLGWFRGKTNVTRVDIPIIITHIFFSYAANNSYKIDNFDLHWWELVIVFGEFREHFCGFKPYCSFHTLVTF
jgi:hypothetical protein